VKVAVVGSGVSGLVAAWLLRGAHEVTLLEADTRIGGHVRTVPVRGPDGDWAVDTGFIVFNERNYPLFCRLLGRLGVPSRPGDMSFSVHEEATGIEWNGSTLDGLFAQRRNLLRPSHLRMLREILRFHREAPSLLAEGPEVALGEWVEGRGFSPAFRERFLVPMAAALWSADPERIREFPARSFARFFHNHGMLAVNGRPRWRTVVGGSARYVERIAADLGDRVRAGCPVASIRRLPDRVRVAPAGAPPEEYDQVVLAVHSDRALALLEDPSDAERAVLGAIPYQGNDAVLHTDASALPRTPRARACWNAFVPRAGRGRATVTYDMNRLQGLPARETYCVTLNRPEAADPSRVLGRWLVHHPVFTTAAPAAQARRDEVSGVRRTWYAGAWWGHGFHEDGVRSAVEVARRLGGDLP
jgi:predicted NAD/FAD-binding protein